MIKKHGKNFWLDFWIGKKRYRRSLGTNERNLAIERARDIKNELLQASQKRDVKLKDFVQQYLEWGWMQKPASMQAEKCRLNRMLQYFMSQKIETLSDIAPLDVEKMRAWLKSEGRSNASINRYCQLLRGMFYRAIDWGKYDKPNPLKKIKFLKESPKIQPLSHADAERAIQAAKEISSNPRSSMQRIFHDLIILIMNTGLRKSEALNLHWQSVKDDSIEITGKGEKKRIVPLNRRARAAIFRQPRRTEFVFDVSNRHQSKNLSRTFIQVRKRIGRPFYLHLLRHYFASTLLEKGIDIVTIAELLGHSKTMTSLLYSHSNPERKQLAVELLERPS